MLKFSEMGLITDDTGDQGDSANRAGILNLCGYKTVIGIYENKGLCTRGEQFPWNNPWNFSRDQLIPLVAGLAKRGYYDACKRIFWTHFKRGFFCQNFERDIPGSTKYPWPHIVEEREVEIVDGLKYIKPKPTWRWFDFADICTPEVIWHMIKCARIYWLYPFAVIGVPWFVLSLAIHCFFRDTDDEGQMISMCAVQGDWAIEYYKRWRPDHKQRLYRYWAERRNQEEIYHLLMDLLHEPN